MCAEMHSYDSCLVCDIFDASLCVANVCFHLLVMWCDMSGRVDDGCGGGFALLVCGAVAAAGGGVCGMGRRGAWRSMMLRWGCSE